MATFFSSFAMLGASGMVYRDGAVFALFSLNVPLGGACIYLLGRQIHRMGRAKGYVTPADLICDHYQSQTSLRLLTALVGFLYAIPYVVMQIQAGGILAQQMFPGQHSFEIGTVVLAFITMLYIMIGGMRSVAWTDVLQGLLLMSGMLLAGAATVAALGGFSAFSEKVAELPRTSLSVPGTTGTWTTTKLFTVCLFGSVGSMIQPAQWMRYYAADSARSLRRSALLFGVVLTACFLFGTMLVGLGGQALYPIQVEGSTILPHPEVGSTIRDFDQIAVVVLKNHLPSLLGPAGGLVTALILVAIIAAAMSTADSNLHAISAVATRDLFDRFIKPNASEAIRLWVGRGMIGVATVLALAIVLVGRHSQHFNPIAMIAQLGLLAIAFSSQLLPITLDIFYIRKGTRAGAIAGLITGLLIVACFSPVFSLLAGNSGAMLDVLGSLRRTLDIGACGFIGNIVVFAAVSCFTRRKE